MTFTLTREEMTVVDQGVAAATNPLVDIAAAVFGVPLCNVYALLWRAGLLTIPEG